MKSAAAVAGFQRRTTLGGSRSTETEEVHAEIVQVVAERLSPEVLQQARARGKGLHLTAFVDLMLSLRQAEA